MHNLSALKIGKVQRTYLFGAQCLEKIIGKFWRSFRTQLAKNHLRVIEVRCQFAQFELFQKNLGTPNGQYVTEIKTRFPDINQ